MEQESIDFEQGWEYIQSGITKKKRYLEGLGPALDPQEYIELYTTVYNLCDSYSQQLYDKYREAVEEYVNSTVLPALMDKDDDEYMLLQELVKRWPNHKKMANFLSSVFHTLDRYFVSRRSLPLVKEVGLTSFLPNNLQRKVKEAVITLVDKERDGEDIDRELVKSVVEFYVEIGMGKMERYEQDFERFLLQGASSYFSRKASRWIEEDSYNDYIVKSEECLEKEKGE
ncbi:unnamed protein product [Microthlaspi erraticum]|uniref:Cullin N-terminal domain-containing protein n=1 Tax=Microthlaspi erraticum TaxID=1685480 RepID=A0A6D2K8B8_9BRAS|nr:unnamed protein product [Microthlaspi erraticum]